MSTTNVSLQFQHQSRELFTTAEAPAAAGESERTLRGGNNSFGKTLGPTTTPAVTAPVISRAITLGGGTTTIDLTAAAVLALPGSATRTQDFTGKKLTSLSIRTASTNNAAGVTVAPGSATPYPLFGSGNTIRLFPDEQVQKAFRETASLHPAVSGSVKLIDIAGTSGDIVYLDLAFG